jgi:hypothetical protein
MMFRVAECTRDILSDLIDLDSGLHWGRPTFLCLGPVTDIFQLRIRWAEVHSCFMGVRKYRKYSYFLQCSCVVKAVHTFYVGLL